MGITAEWDNPQKTIILQVYGANWNWQEYVASFKRIDMLMAEVNHPVGIIAETSAVRRIPQQAIRYGSQAVKNLPPGILLAVIVSPSPFILSIMNIIQRITRYNVRTASTVDEARRLIEAARNDLSRKDQ